MVCGETKTNQSPFAHEREKVFLAIEFWIIEGPANHYVYIESVQQWHEIVSKVERVLKEKHDFNDDLPVSDEDAGCVCRDG